LKLSSRSLVPRIALPPPTSATCCMYMCARTHTTHPNTNTRSGAVGGQMAGVVYDTREGASYLEPHCYHLLAQRAVCTCALDPPHSVDSTRPLNRVFVRKSVDRSARGRKHHIWGAAIGVCVYTTIPVGFCKIP